jgi:hypothetical protein
VNHLFITLAILSVLGDLIALYFAFHSRKHEKENTQRLARIEAAVSPENGIFI